MKSIFFWTIFLSVATGAFSSIFIAVSLSDFNTDYSADSILASRDSEYRHSGFFDLEKDILRYVGFPSSRIEGAGEYDGYWVQAGITSHHLPTALPFISEFYKTIQNSDGPRETFAIIGPDHLEKCRGDAAVTYLGYRTPFGELNVDKDAVRNLVNAGATLDDECFDGEHSIAVQTLFIKYLYPNAKIVPILFSSDASGELVDKIVNSLFLNRDKIAVIGSVDFSHYESYERAKEIDDASENMIRNMDWEGFALKHADSPASLGAVILFSNKTGAINPLIIGRANSYEFNSSKDNTTGYMNALFANYKKTKGILTLAFVGDIMLTRNVGKKIEESGDWRWPFLKIGDYLRSADLTFGNLETTISERGHNVGSIYSFRSNPKVIEGLLFAGFDFLSVANNHMGDWTRTAFEDTFNILKANGIGYVGGGFSEKEAHSAKAREISGIKFGFLGYTDLGAKYTEAKGDISGIAWSSKETIERDVKEAKNTSDFVVVSIHFGEEYKTSSNARQKILARAAVDAGASLVIGHHPHVIQEIEEYNGGYIAYSLGNFIFDQNFSEETMEGLILKVYVKNSKILNMESEKVNISGDFQAYFRD